MKPKRPKGDRSERSKKSPPRDGRTVKEGRSLKKERTLKEGRTARVKEKTPEEEEEVKAFALALSASVGDALRSVQSPKITTPKKVSEKGGPVSPTTRLGATKKENDKEIEGEVHPSPPSNPLAEEEIPKPSPRMSQRRTTMLNDANKLNIQKELEEKVKAEKAATIQGSYLNNAADLILTLSSNELNKN